MHVPKDERYLGFMLGQERFAIPLLQVKEVIGVPEFTRMPFAPSYFKGLLNLRGQVIATIDLRQKFQFSAKPSPENAVIVCDVDDVMMGAMVDSVDFVFRASEDQIQTRIDVDSSMKADHIAGLFHHKSGLVIMLDLRKVLSIQDVLAIKAQKDKSQVSTEVVLEGGSSCWVA
jgi:purine-binding chemotaxis protein CheW